MLETIVSIQPKDSSGTGGETREAVVYRIAGEMLGKMPNDYAPHEVIFIHNYVVKAAASNNKKLLSSLSSSSLTRNALKVA